MIQVEWCDEAKTEIRLILRDGWTWADFYIAQRDADALIETVPGIVDGLFLPENSKHLPPNALSNLRSIVTRRHPRYGYTFVIGVHSYIATMLNAVAQLLPHYNSVRFVDTEEEALVLLREVQAKRTSQTSKSR